MILSTQNIELSSRNKVDDLSDLDLERISKWAWLQKIDGMIEGVIPMGPKKEPNIMAENARKMRER